MEQSKVVQVDEESYLITHPDPETAYKIGIELMKLIGEPMAMITSAVDQNEGIKNATQALFQNLDADKTFGLVKKMIGYVEYQGDGDKKQKVLLTGASFNLHFKGRTGHMIKLVGEVIEFQQKDFFSAIMDGIAKIKTGNNKTP